MPIIGGITSRISKLFSKVGPELVGGLKNVWHSRQANKAAAEAAFKNIDDLSKIGGKFSYELSNLADNAAHELMSAKSKISSLISKFPAELSGTKAYIQKLDQIDLIIKKNPEEAAKLINDMIGEIHKTDVNALISALESSGKISGEFQKVNTSSMITKYVDDVLQSLNTSKFQANKAAQLAKEIGATRFGGSDIDFVNQYLKHYKRSESIDAQKWFANPHNIDRLDKLKSSGRVEKILSELEGKATKLPMSVRLEGLTYGDVATRLGIGAAAVGAASVPAVTGVFDWFESAKNAVSADVSELEATLSQLHSKTSGRGKDILSAVNNAMRNIGIESINVKNNMEKDVPNAINTFVEGIARQHETISGAIDNWSTVVQSSSDKQLAQKAGQLLEAFARLIEGKFKELGASVGVTPKVKSEELVENANIMQIQQALRLPVSGELDDNTVSALKDIENKMNMHAGTTEFTGMLYNPAKNHIIQYKDLLEINRRLSKY